MKFQFSSLAGYRPKPACFDMMVLLLPREEDCSAKYSIFKEMPLSLRKQEMASIYIAVLPLS
jgi:hypothetical protein